MTRFFLPACRRSAKREGGRRGRHSRRGQRTSRCWPFGAARSVHRVSGGKMTGNQKLGCELTVKAGRAVWDLNGISRPLWTEKEGSR